jgi:hypothetical protein
MFVIFQPDAQRTDIASGRAYRNHIHRKYYLFHMPPPSLFDIIIAHMFDYRKWNLVVANWFTG